MNQPTLHETVLFQFQHCGNIMRRMHHRHEFGPDEMNPGQSRVIALVAHQEGISQKELADLMQIRPASLSELLDKLENESLIERRISEADRRLTTLFLTEKSRQLVDKIRTARQELSANMFPNMETEELQQLSGLMGKLISGLESRMAAEPRGPRPDFRDPRQGGPFGGGDPRGAFGGHPHGGFGGGDPREAFGDPRQGGPRRGPFHMRGW